MLGVQVLLHRDQVTECYCRVWSAPTQTTGHRIVAITFGLQPFVQSLEGVLRQRSLSQRSRSVSGLHCQAFEGGRKVDFGRVGEIPVERVKVSWYQFRMVCFVILLVAGRRNGVRLVSLGQFEGSFLLGQEHFLLDLSLLIPVPATAAASPPRTAECFVGSSPSNHGSFCQFYMLVEIKQSVKENNQESPLIFVSGITLLLFLVLLVYFLSNLIMHHSPVPPDTVLLDLIICPKIPSLQICFLQFYLIHRQVSLLNFLLLLYTMAVLFWLGFNFFLLSLLNLEFLRNWLFDLLMARQGLITNLRLLALNLEKRRVRTFLVISATLHRSLSLRDGLLVFIRNILKGQQSIRRRISIFHPQLHHMMLQLSFSVDHHNRMGFLSQMLILLMNGLLADRAHQYRPWTATFEASLAFVFEDQILAFLGASFTGGAYLRRAVLASKDSAHEIDLSAKKTSKTLLEVYFAVEKLISNLFLQFSLIGNESLCQIRFTHLLLYPSFPLSTASLQFFIKRCLLSQILSKLIPLIRVIGIDQCVCLHRLLRAHRIFLRLQERQVGIRSQGIPWGVWHSRMSLQIYCNLAGLIYCNFSGLVTELNTLPHG